MEPAAALPNRLLAMIKGNAVQQVTFLTAANRFLNNLAFAEKSPQDLAETLQLCFGVVLGVFRDHAAIIANGEVAEEFLDVG